jgi:hypothetical protein
MARQFWFLDNEHNKSLTMLEGVSDRSSPGMLSWIEADSDLDPIRADPRYQPMIDKAKARRRDSCLLRRIAENKLAL